MPVPKRSSLGRMIRSICSLFLLGGLTLVACHSEQETPPQKSEGPSPEEGKVLSGEQLARTHCQSCHTFPEPTLLDRKTWAQVVLPRMKHRLGLYDGQERPDSLFEDGVAGTLVRNANVFPENPALPQRDWERVVEYYLREAPDSLPPPPDRSEITTGLDHFRVRTPSFRTMPPTTSLVATSLDANTYVGDAKGSLTILNPQLRERFTMDIPNAPVTLRRVRDQFFLGLIGRVAPSDAPSGRLMRLDLKIGAKKYRYGTVLDSLQRPVDLSFADLTGNGRLDVVVSEFGYRTGRLSWFENVRSETPTKHVLRGEPGAIRTEVRDFNGNGRLDVMALMGQGDEGIYLYHNEGNGTFREERLLRFPPSYGSTSFELIDINGDGALDIVHTAGDNADYEPVMKPYHGVRIFLNDRDNSFEQAYFYPLNGAYGAVPTDFDGDGDVDIAAISFFPNYRAPGKESFVYLKNTGSLEFEASTFPKSDRGRWLVMNGGDIDQDGDDDLILGSFSALQLGTPYVPEELASDWTQNGPSVVVLENTIAPGSSVRRETDAQ